MTTISQIIGQANVNAGSVAASGGATSYSDQRRVNDGYSSFTGSVLRNTATGAALGAVGGLAVGMPLPGAAIGAVGGAASAAVRHPRVAQALGEGMRGAMAGAAGGALVGTVTPLGPVGGAVAGAVGGAVTGVASNVLNSVTGGKFSIEKETSVLGRLTKGFALGAASGGTVGLGAGLLFGGIGAIPGTLIGAAIGGVGGALYGLTTGVTDAATGAKGVSLTGSSSSGSRRPSQGDTGSGISNLRERIERWTDGGGTEVDYDSVRQYARCDY